MEFISEGIVGKYSKMKILVLKFLKNGNFKPFSGIASSMKMLSTNLRVEYVWIYVHIYIGGLMGNKNISTYIIIIKIFDFYIYKIYIQAG